MTRPIWYSHPPLLLLCTIKELCSLNISSLLWLIKLQLCICNLSTFSRVQGCDKDDGPDEGHQQIFRGEKMIFRIDLELILFLGERDLREVLHRSPAGESSFSG